MQIETTVKNHLTPIKMAVIYIKKNPLVRMWSKGHPSALMVGMLVQPLWKTAWRILKKLEIYNPAFLLLSIDLKMKTLIRKGSCIPSSLQHYLQ